MSELLQKEPFPFRRNSVVIGNCKEEFEVLGWMEHMSMRTHL